MTRPRDCPPFTLTVGETLADVSRYPSLDAAILAAKPVLVIMLQKWMRRRMETMPPDISDEERAFYQDPRAVAWLMEAV